MNCVLTRNLCHTTFITAYNPQQAIASFSKENVVLKKLPNCQGHVLGDPEVTANLYCNFAYVSVLGRLRDLLYIFAVTSGSPSTQCRGFSEGSPPFVWGLGEGVVCLF